MCFSAEASLITSGVLVLVGLAMMIRRTRLDVILAGFILALAIIQIVEFGLHSGVIGSQEGGKMLFVTLVFQCAIFAASAWAVFGGYIVGGLAIGMVGLLGAALFILPKSKFSATPGQCGHMEWSRDGNGLLGNLGAFYLIGIFAPLVFVTAYAQTMSGFAIGSILGIYGVCSALYVYLMFPTKQFSSMWCFLSVGFGALAWLLGAYYA